MKKLKIIRGVFVAIIIGVVFFAPIIRNNFLDEQNKNKLVYNLLGTNEAVRHSEEEVIDNSQEKSNIQTEVKSKTVFYSGDKTKKQAALTFDDGPDSTYTDKVLDILKKYNIKATFFVIGKNAESYPNVLKRMENEGHAIGNHTYSHKNLDGLKEEEISLEIKKTEKIIQTILCKYKKIMRPPYGNNSIATIKAVSSLGYEIIDWSVDTRDWAGTSPNKIMEYINAQIHPGAIILHHCNKNTIEVLPREIEELTAQGYEFVNVVEMLNFK